MILRRSLLIAAAAAALAAPALAAASDFVGEWYGVRDIGSARLRLRFMITAEPRATLMSLDQPGPPVLADSVEIEGDRIIMRFTRIGVLYEGRLEQGRVVGSFTQGSTVPMTLTREAQATEYSPLTQSSLAALLSESGAFGIAAAAANRTDRKLALAAGVRIDGGPAVTAADKWHLGSITKSMTATLIARLVEAGSIKWNDTVGEALGAAAPEMRDEYRDCTFLHLLSHRAGVQANIDLADLVKFPRESADARADRVAYARLALAQAPVGQKETSFLYSNSGYVLAGAMLEAKLGKPWEALISEHVFSPLGMKGAGFGAPGTPGANDQPVGHAASPSGEPVAVPPAGPASDNPAVLGPAGRVHAPFDDVLTYLAAHRDRTAFLSRPAWERLQSPPFGGGYALGWMKRNGAIWHNGSNTAFYAEVMFDSARGVAAVAAVNDGRVASVTRPVGAALMSAAAGVEEG